MKGQNLLGVLAAWSIGVVAWLGAGLYHHNACSAHPLTQRTWFLGSLDQLPGFRQPPPVVGQYPWDLAAGEMGELSPEACDFATSTTGALLFFAGFLVILGVMGATASRIGAHPSLRRGALTAMTLPLAMLAYGLWIEGAAGDTAPPRAIAAWAAFVVVSALIGALGAYLVRSR